MPASHRPTTRMKAQYHESAEWLHRRLQRKNTRLLRNPGRDPTISFLFTDLSFPLFALEIALVVNKFLDSSVFFYYLICLSLLALSLTAFFLKKNHSFSYRRFGKFFWRSGFIVTFIFYIVVVILIFTMA